jgi:uncharacterized protein DUF4440
MWRLFSILMLLLVVKSGFAQAPEPALQRAIQERSSAQQAGDGPRWAKYTTDDFMAIGADGSVKDKAKRVQEISATKLRDPAPALDEKFRRYGTTVIRTWRTSPQEGQPMYFTEVWVNQDGRWQVASVHMSAMKR